MIFKHILIFRYTLVIPIHWFICGGLRQYQHGPPQIDVPKDFDSLTSLNKHEHCTFQSQNGARVFYMNVEPSDFRDAENMDEIQL